MLDHVAADDDVCGNCCAIGAVIALFESKPSTELNLSAPVAWVKAITGVACARVLNELPQEQALPAPHFDDSAVSDAPLLDEMAHQTVQIVVKVGRGSLGVVVFVTVAELLEIKGAVEYEPAVCTNGKIEIASRRLPGGGRV